MSNIKLHMGDARDSDGCFARRKLSARPFCFIPDPWPKLRHHRRRFVTPEHLETVEPLPENGGAEFRVATDIEDYVRQTLREVPKAGFDWLVEGPEDWRAPWRDWISTRYEQKALREARTPALPMTFQKS